MKLKPLSEQIALATIGEPNADVSEEEDDITNAKFVDDEILPGDESLDVGIKSVLRLRNAPNLDDTDRRYRGKKVSRHQLDELKSLEAFDNENVEGDDVDWAGNMEVSDEEETADSSTEGSNNKDDSSSLSSFSEEDTVTFSRNNDCAIDVERGKHVQSQLKLYESLLEIRIKMQNIINKLNRYPQSSDWDKFGAAEGVKQCQADVQRMAKSLLQLQCTFLSCSSDPHLRCEATAENTSYSENFKAFQYETIEKWNNKTRLTSNRHIKASKKGENSFSDFETSITKQIEHILANKSRLIKRTQLKRSAYSIFGRESCDENDQYDTEIFDDDDFYHQLLQDFIERKSELPLAGAEIAQKWLKVQKMRSKMKKRVDTKASKGRRVRYDIHSKLVNYMAPIHSEGMSETAKKELFSSLFGKSHHNMLAT